jgi:hypothetical protein
MFDQVDRHVGEAKRKARLIEWHTVEKETHLVVGETIEREAHAAAHATVAAHIHALHACKHFTQIRALLLRACGVDDLHGFRRLRQALALADPLAGHDHLRRFAPGCC